MNFNTLTLTLTLRQNNSKTNGLEKTKLNNESGICPNLTFEDDEFKEDNKALNDQCEVKRERMLFYLP